MGGKLRKNRSKLEFKITENGCFEIINKTPYSTGYCHITNGSERKLAHRHIYEQCFGEIPKGLVVRHKCDNKLCINPEHLELGTLADNIKDKVERNRCAKGEKIASSKLKREQIGEILKLRKEGLTLHQVAKKYNISHTQVWNIEKRMSWNE